MALASTTRSPFVPLTLKSGSKTPHGAPRRDIAAVPTGWNTLHPIEYVRGSEREVIQGLNIRPSVVPCILGNLLIRVRGFQRLPRRNGKPSPGLSAHEPFGGFDGGNYHLDVEVGRQVIGIDHGRLKWIRTPQFDISTCPKNNEGSNEWVDRTGCLREVGEMRLLATVIQFPSGIGALDRHPFIQMSW